MSKAMHTPGPWHIQSRWNTENAKGAFIEIRCKKTSTMGFGSLCRVRGDKRFVDDAVMLANARLIAAAPELLEALKTAHAHIADDVLRASIGNIIAKATP